MERMILHCDCNGFYASVAEQVNPELKKVPMAVCGDPESRHGIVLAKNELAKAYHIQTAETIWEAKRKCPHLVLAPTYRKLYQQYFYQINQIYEEYTDLVERFGIDESFLDVTGSVHLFGGDPVVLANHIRQQVQKETGLTISVGVSYNKFFAKMGSDYKKPNAVTHITENNYQLLLWPLPVSEMFMVGKATQKVLKSMYIETIGDLAKMNPTVLTKKFGKMGNLLYLYANGLDDSPVVSYREAEGSKSIGNGHTFKRNLLNLHDIQVGVAALAETVATRMRKENVKCTTLQVTIKDANFKSITRQKSLDNPTYSSKEIEEYALEIIQSSWRIGVPIRMLTITAQKLISAEEAVEQISFFDTPKTQEKTKKQQELEQTMDQLREKFGNDSIVLGSLLDNDLGI